MATAAPGIDVEQQMQGEWALGADILGCERALLGRVVVSASGDAVYLAMGDDFCGRGVGHWSCKGGVVAFDLDVIQYAPNSTKSDILRFRGVGLPPDRGLWFGEMFVLDPPAEPHLVGRFNAFRHGESAGSMRPPPKMLPSVPTRGVQAASQVLDKLQQPVALSGSPQWDNYKIPGLDGAFLVPNYLTAEQSQSFLQTCDERCQFERMMTRSTDEVGSGAPCQCGRGLTRESLPDWMEGLTKTLHALGIFHPILYPVNSVRVNAYEPGQGIHPHLDGPVYYPMVATVSFGSRCVFDFWPPAGPASTRWDPVKEVPASPEVQDTERPAVSLVLEPGSLLVFSGDAFLRHRHGFAPLKEDVVHDRVVNAKACGFQIGDRFRRSRRVSLTIRHLLPRCNCQP